MKEQNMHNCIKFTIFSTCSIYEIQNNLLYSNNKIINWKTKIVKQQIKVQYQCRQAYLHRYHLKNYQLYTVKAKTHIADPQNIQKT